MNENRIYEVQVQGATHVDLVVADKAWSAVNETHGHPVWVDKEGEGSHNGWITYHVETGPGKRMTVLVREQPEPVPAAPLRRKCTERNEAGPPETDEPVEFELDAPLYSRKRKLLRE